jgi:hypothetical protein
MLKCTVGAEVPSGQDIIIKMALPEIDGEELAQRMNNSGATLDGILVCICHLGALFQEGG